MYLAPSLANTPPPFVLDCNLADGHSGPHHTTAGLHWSTENWMTDTAESALGAGERHRVADLLDRHASTLAEFAVGKEQLVGLIAFMLRLDTDAAHPDDRPDLPDPGSPVPAEFRHVEDQT